MTTPDGPNGAEEDQIDGPRSTSDWFAPPEGKVVEADAFVLRDRQAPIRAILRQREGSVGLALSDGEGQGRAWLGVREDGCSFLCFVDRNQAIRLSLNLTDADGPEIQIADENQVPRAKLHIPPRGHPILTLLDEAANPRVFLTLHPDGEPNLSFVAADATPVAGLKVTDDGSPMLILTHPDGTPMATIQRSDDGTGEIQLSDPDGDVIWAAPAGAGEAPDDE